MTKVYNYKPTFWLNLKRIVQDNPDIDTKVADKILNFQSCNKKTDALYWIGRMMKSVGAVDRTGKLNHFKTQYTPIPTINQFNKSFSEICLETANEFWNKNDLIEISWSGGIDSTAAALALLETKPLDKTLIIGGTLASIAEYPKFYKSNKSIFKIINDEKFFSKERFECEHLVLTGDGGDQLWGSNAVAQLSSTDILKKNLPWQDLLDWTDVFNQSLIPKNFPPGSIIPKGWYRSVEPWSREQKDKFISILTDHATACPFEIKTCFDMLWWLNFSTKLNFVRISMVTMAAYQNKLTSVNLNNFIPFYLTDDFQRWSLCNHHRKEFLTPESYKQEAKEFIFSINKDSDYLKNKLKEESTPKMIKLKWKIQLLHDSDNNYAIMNDGKVYSKGNDMPINVIENIFQDT